MPLYQHVMVGQAAARPVRLLRRRRGSRVRQGGCSGQRRAGPDRPGRLGQQPDEGPSHAAGPQRRDQGRGGRPVGNGRRVWIPSRVDVVDRLDREGLLPAIVFIFSRVGCDAAVAAVRQGQRAADLDRGARRDLRLRRGVLPAPARGGPPRPGLPRLPRRAHARRGRPPRGHAAGVQGGASRSCSCAVCARSCSPPRRWRSGINMPARTVVHREARRSGTARRTPTITPGEYTQLTGRAGRRGLDVEGHGVVLWQPGMNPRELAGLASTRTYPLRSSFAPSYNMAVNLVHQFGRAARPRAAGAVVRPVPGRQGRRRAGAAAAQGRGGARRLCRGGHLRPGRLHGVRPHPPPDLRAREGRVAGASCRPAGGGGLLAGAAAPRRRDPGACGQVRRLRRRRRPRHVGGGAPAARRDGRAAGQAAQPRRLSRPRWWR